MSQATRNVDITTDLPTVVKTVRNAAGDKIRVYQGGTGWNASEGRLATASELQEVGA